MPGEVKVGFLILLLWVNLATVQVQAASFDCERASSVMEHLICEDTRISHLDEVLAAAYGRALRLSSSPASLRDEQREWLQVIRNACPDASCLTVAYRRRIRELHQQDGWVVKNDMSAAALRMYLRQKLTLPAGRNIRLIPLRSAGNMAAEMVAFFVDDSQGEARRGLVEVTGPQPVVRTWGRYDCNCSVLSEARAVRFLLADTDFVVTRYTPRTGTCVGYESMQILRIDARGQFDIVWSGYAYRANGSDMEMAKISFIEVGAGADMGILREARQQRCREGCLCRKGVAVRDYVELFTWDRSRGRFHLAR